MGWSCCQITNCKRRAGKVGNRTIFYIYISIYIKFLIFKHWVGIFWLFPWKKKSTCGQPCSPQGLEEPFDSPLIQFQQENELQSWTWKETWHNGSWGRIPSFPGSLVLFWVECGCPPLSPACWGGSETPRLVVSVLSAGWGQEWGDLPFPRADSRAVIAE